MKPHAFVAMPFGTKPGHDAEPIDFNRVYAEYIGPALEAAGFEVFRADQEQRAGDIRADMFQELLMADLVVAEPEEWIDLIEDFAAGFSEAPVEAPQPGAPQPE